LQYFLSGHRDATVTYWDKRGEVDLVLSSREYRLPIEVKRGDTENRSLRGLRNFMDEYGCGFGLAVNDAGTTKHDENDIIHVPSWLFFYLS
jgi:predicted AAA+ superfamily ATPase